MSYILFKLHPIKSIQIQLGSNQMSLCSYNIYLHQEKTVEFLKYRHKHAYMFSFVLYIVWFVN